VKPKEEIVRQQGINARMGMPSNMVFDLYARATQELADLRLKEIEQAIAESREKRIAAQRDMVEKKG
jgi:hypothetical protein